MAILHAYTATVADGTAAGIVKASDWVAAHAVDAGTELNGLAPVGSVLPFAGTIASLPGSWKLCNGESLLRAGTYADLFAIIGTVYGAVDGDHFSLPDLRDRFIVGAKQDDSSVPKASITGGLTQSYAPASWNLTHGLTVDAHTLAHAGFALGDHNMTHTVQIADHPSVASTAMTLSIAPQATAGRSGTKVPSPVVSASTHAWTGPSLAARSHAITQPDHSVTHAITQPDSHGTITHALTAPPAHTAAVTTIVPAFLALAFIIRYA